MPEREPGAPAQITPTGLADYLETMSKSVFQTGISWAVVEKKWPGIREAFDGFDAKTVADYKPEDVDRLVADPRVIRNRRKIEGIVGNARAMVALDREHGGFQKYLRSHSSYDALAKDLRKRFKFLGDMGCYHFLYVVSEPVPEYHEWRETHETGRRPSSAKSRIGR